MDEKNAKALWGMAKGTLFLLLLTDFGVVLRILTAPMTQGWLVFWLVALTATYLADLTSYVVLATKLFEREVTSLETAITLVSWIMFTFWVGWGSFLILTTIPAINPSSAVIGACVLAALYFMVKLMCYCSPGNGK